MPPNPPNRVWGPGWRAAERAMRPAGERGEAATEENGPNNWKRERDLCQATLWAGELLARWPPESRPSVSDSAAASETTDRLPGEANEARPT